MKQQDKELFEKLGYNTRDKGLFLLDDIISEVQNCMEQYSTEEIEQIVNDKKSFIYVELGCFYYEIGLNMFNKELNRVHEERDKNSIEIETYTNVFDTNNNPSLEESIISIANYRTKQKQVNNGNVVKVKCIRENNLAM